MTASSRPRHTTAAPADFLLTPAAQAALLGFNAFQVQVQLWRSMTDSVRQSVRSQQDAMLKLWLRGVVVGGPNEESAPEKVSVEDVSNGAATEFLMPVLAARRAYVQMSGAMMEAQREALATLMSGRAH